MTVMRFVRVLIVIFLVLASCAPNEQTEPSDELSGTVSVGAAASLTEAFTKIGSDFEDLNPRANVVFNFGASSALAKQIQLGAPIEVFISADKANMDEVVAAGMAEDTKIIARNRLVILVEKGNPKNIAGLEDLDRSDILLALCAPQVPCGKFGAVALAKSKVSRAPTTLEENVKGVVTKVRLGEVDAGLVYVTDAKAAVSDTDDVAIDIASDPELEAVYPAAAIKSAKSQKLADAFIDYLLSSGGQQTLREFGFLSPE